MDRKTLLVSICSLLGFLLPAYATHYEVFILAGQSNMDGRAHVKDLTGELEKYKEPRKDVLIHFTAGGLKRPLTVVDEFKPLQPGFSGTPGKPEGIPSANFGPEIAFGAEMAAAMPGKHILLVKCAEGGTNLHTEWNPNQKGKLYDRLMAWVAQTKKEIQDKGDTFEIRGMLWHQGEADNKTSTVESYQALLTELIGRVRSDLGIKDLPFVIGQVYDNGNRNTIIEAQKATAKAVPNTAFAEGDGLVTFDKGTHFDAPSQIELGKRFAREMKDLLAKPKAAAR